MDLIKTVIGKRGLLLEENHLRTVKCPWTSDQHAPFTFLTVFLIQCKKLRTKQKYSKKLQLWLFHKADSILEMLKPGLIMNLKSFGQTSSYWQSLQLFWHENCWLQNQNSLLTYLQILFGKMQMLQIFSLQKFLVNHQVLF